MIQALLRDYRKAHLLLLWEDDIIRQLDWDWSSFFTYNRGTLNNGCSTRNGWTVYDCNTNVMYTMPHNNDFYFLN